MNVSFCGVRLAATSNGFFMDVDRALSVNTAHNGDRNKAIQFISSSGMRGSALEHIVPEQFYSTPANPAEGISAVKVLQIANDQGIPIYTINQSNIVTILPQLELDNQIIVDIQNAVNTGKEVAVPKTNIMYDEWIGTGYIIIDPNTGSGGYIISGGLSGARILKALETLIINLYLLPSGRGFDEASEAWDALKTELAPICAYWVDYFRCLAAVSGVSAAVMAPGITGLAKIYGILGAGSMTLLFSITVYGAVIAIILIALWFATYAIAQKAWECIEILPREY
jgi:hypothetical protein